MITGKRSDQKNIQKEIDVLGKVSSTIVSDMYLEDTLKMIVSLTAEVMGSKICSLMLLNEEGTELHLAATQSLSREYINKPNVNVGQSVSGRAVTLKKPVTVTDIKKEKDYMFPGIAKKEKLSSMLAIPLVVQGKVIGILNSYTYRKHKFTNKEIKLVSAVANLAAIAIYNRQLAEEKRTLAVKLEERKIIERAKGLIMKREGISEDEAYRMLQRRSMDTRKSMREIAEEEVQNQ